MLCAEGMRLNQALVNATMLSIEAHANMKDRSIPFPTRTDNLSRAEAMVKDAHDAFIEHRTHCAVCGGRSPGSS